MNYEQTNTWQTGIPSQQVPYGVDCAWYDDRLKITASPAQCLLNAGPRLSNKRPKPEEIMPKLRQVEALMGQGQMCVRLNDYFSGPDSTKPLICCVIKSTFDLWNS